MTELSILILVLSMLTVVLTVLTLVDCVFLYRRMVTNAKKRQTRGE